MNEDSSARQSIALITMSYRGDLELCALLCETIDDLVPTEFHHLLAVPKADMRLFARFANSRRSLVAQESLLPAWLHRAPLPGPDIRRRLRLPRRDVYFGLRCGLVRGWIAQQIMKFAAAASCGCDVILHVDSDVTFVRPLTKGHLVREGKVRLLHMPDAGNTPLHHPWHEAASKLLGLPNTCYHGADWIGHLTIWRRSVVEMVLDRIATTTSCEPKLALARTPDFSEYVLYGAFVDRVLGMDRSGHYPTNQPLCASIWTGREAQELNRTLQTLTIEPTQVAVAIQSTLPISINDRQNLFRRVKLVC